MSIVKTLRPVLFVRELVRSFNNWINGGKDVVRLWVDDVRPAPRGWYWATTADEAIDVLRSCYVERLSLDHDLGDGRDGIAVVRYLADMREILGHNFWPERRPVVHSQNPVGRANMEALINRYGRYEDNRRK